VDGGGIPVTPLLIGAGIGVLRAGESPQPPNLSRAATTSMNSRNLDGGFGESTLACLDDGQRGRGTSTRTQTLRVLEFDQTT
jgi:hypothetical protein